MGNIESAPMEIQFAELVPKVVVAALVVGVAQLLSLLLRLCRLRLPQLLQQPWCHPEEVVVGCVAELVAGVAVE